MTNLHEDLANRWAPSPEQIELAKVALEQSGQHFVYTLHLLLNKTWGIWTDKVTVVHLPGVFLDRDEATTVLDTAALEHYNKTEQSVVGGWTSHSSSGGWAVFDDPVASYSSED